MESVSDNLPPAGARGESLLPLHPGIRMVWMLGALIGTGVLTAMGAGVDAMIRAETRGREIPLGVIGGAIGLAAGLASLVHATLKYRYWGYLVREHDVVIASGVIWRKRCCVPRPRVQHVDISSGPLDRAFSLVQVSLHVAGGMGPVAVIPGLSQQAAEQLREALIATATDGV